ncbi:MAG: glycine/sarcosine/betaine reductase component B subunit [Candidatus Binatia bacterium]
MRLELADFPVTQVFLGNEFRYDSGTLEVDQEELTRNIRQDRRVKDATLAVVVPGEKVRVTGVRDVVEPRFKVRGKGQVFPGILSPVAPVGDGRTHRLSGMAVVVAAEYEGTIRAGTAVQRSAILDMWGPGAEISRFSSQVNLVLILHLVQGLPEIEAHAAIQRAECEVARRLGEATTGQEPQRVEVFELEESNASLPRVVLIQGCLTDSHHPHSGVGYYGLPIRDSLATTVHPNEFLDGAVTVDTTRAQAVYPTTWDWLNHPLLLGLYRERSQRLNFVGVILERIRFETHQGKEVIAQNTAQLAATLRADAALVTWMASGNAFVDVMLTVRACEQRGIKTVLLTYEYGGRDGTDSPLLYYVPEADRVVSTGSRDRWLELPAPERVVGPSEQVHLLSYPGAPVVPAWNPLTLDARDIIIGGVDIWGRHSWTCSGY